MFNLLKRKTPTVDQAHVATYGQLVRKSAKADLTPAEQSRLDAAAEALKIGPDGPAYILDKWTPTTQLRSISADREAVQRSDRLEPMAAGAESAKQEAAAAADTIEKHDAETRRMISELTKKRESERQAHSKFCQEARDRREAAKAAAEELTQLRRTAWRILGTPDPGAPGLPSEDLPEARLKWARETTAFELRNEGWRFLVPHGEYGGVARNDNPKFREQALLEWMEKTALEVQEFVT